MASSTGHGLKWPIRQGELGQRTEDSQIIHKHNGHQYWKDDRWGSQKRPGFNFCSFFGILQETVSLFTKSFVSHKANEEKPSFSKSEPRAVVPVTQMTKWIKHGAMMADINNDGAWWALSGKREALCMQWVFFWPPSVQFLFFYWRFTDKSRSAFKKWQLLAWVKWWSDQSL